MTHKLRRVRKLRGSRTHGFGQVAGHRESGSRGGKGKGGTHGHRWVSPAPKYEGKHGFTRKATISWKALNIGEIDGLVSGLQNKKTDDRGRTILDLKALGYTKLLGKGSVKNGYVVIVDGYSEKASEKLLSVGGEVKASTG